MFQELKLGFQAHARIERYETSDKFFAYKMEENSSTSEHVLEMSGYYNRLNQVGVNLLDKIVIAGFLQPPSPSYKSFMMNYNMQGKLIPELFVMLKAVKVEVKKEHQVLMVNKTTSFKKNGKGKKGNFKKNDKQVATPMKKPKARPKPGTECFYCKENGHWKRKCPEYLVDKKDSKVNKGIFDIQVIDVYITSVYISPWVFDTCSVAKN